MRNDARPLIVAALGLGFLLTLAAANDPFIRPHPCELLPSGTDEPAADLRIVRDLTTLTAAEAAALDGQQARFRVAIDSPPSDRLGCVCYGYATPDGVERTLFLRDGEADRDRLEVEGTLRVLHHPAAVHGGMAFTAFTEYRLVDAERQ